MTTQPFDHYLDKFSSFQNLVNILIEKELESKNQKIDTNCHKVALDFFASYNIQDGKMSDITLKPMSNAVEKQVENELKGKPNLKKIVPFKIVHDRQTKKNQVLAPDSLMQNIKPEDLENIKLKLKAEGQKAIVKGSDIHIDKMSQEEEKVLTTAFNNYLKIYKEARKVLMMQAAMNETAKEHTQAEAEAEKMRESLLSQGIKGKGITTRNVHEVTKDGKKEEKLGKPSENVTDFKSKIIEKAATLNAKHQEGHKKEVKERKDTEKRTIDKHHKKDDLKLDNIKAKNIRESEGIPPSSEK